MRAVKRKILFISDHQLSTSGVGTQARWLINGLIATGKYSFRCLGGAVKHESYEPVVVNPDFVIKPIDGFGNRDLLRQILVTERPDAVVIFTDPRFFLWLFESEDELHQVCPLVYNHLWDNDPAPVFNRVLYESCDAINCINWPTYQFVHEWFPDKTRYVPHAVPSDLYFPFDDEKRQKIRAELLGSTRADHFVGLWVGRNARRKMPSDLVLAWKMFVERLRAEEGHDRATLVMHTDPHDPEGTNLHHVLDLTGMRGHVFFSNDRVGFDNMNMLYNAADVNFNISSNEGFGLPILEGLMTGLPAVVIKTGGITRQVVDHETGQHHGIALDPEVRPLVGNQIVPYIHEDYVSHKTYADAIWRMHAMGREKRRELGELGRAYVDREYRMDRLISAWDETLEKTIDSWKKQPRKGWRSVVL